MAKQYQKIEFIFDEDNPFAHLPPIEPVTKQTVNMSHPQRIAAFLLGHGFQGQMISTPGKDDQFVVRLDLIVKFAQEVLELKWFTQALGTACMKDLGLPRVRGHAIPYYSISRERWIELHKEIAIDPPVRLPGDEERIESFRKKVFALQD